MVHNGGWLIGISNLLSLVNGDGHLSPHFDRERVHHLCHRPKLPGALYGCEKIPAVELLR